MRKDSTKLVAASLIVLTSATAIVLAHCQIPCGIYDDSVRFSLMREHVTTIEKSMNEIISIGKEKNPNNNQFDSFLMNKDDHANELSEIATYYFMAQRVKPVQEDNKAEYEKYIKQITLLHQIVVQAMKAKQTTDMEICSKLKTLINQFETSYNSK
jgi:nickel superoxide dismutase